MEEKLLSPKWFIQNMKHMMDDPAPDRKGEVRKEIDYASAIIIDNSATKPQLYI